jgi:hypothetical protein
MCRVFSNDNQTRQKQDDSFGLDFFVKNGFPSTQDLSTTRKRNCGKHAKLRPGTQSYGYLFGIHKRGNTDAWRFVVDMVTWTPDI